MTTDEQNAYELVCRQLDEANSKLAKLQAAIKRAIANEFSLGDCPMTVQILAEALESARQR